MELLTRASGQGGPPASRPKNAGEGQGLVRASLFVRRLVRRAHGLLLTVAIAAWVVAGGATLPASLPLAVVASLWAALLLTRLYGRLSRSGRSIVGGGSSTPGRGLLLDIELGALLAVGLDAALLRFEGGLSGPLSPAVYVLVALVASFARPLAGIAVVAWVVLLEAAIRRVTLGETGLQVLSTHAAFVTAFALLNLAFLRVEVARIRATARARIEEELRRLKDDARRYRLLGAGEAPAESGAAQGERLERSSVEEIHQSVHYALDLLRRTLDLHTAVLLWLNDAGTHLRISELSTGSDDIHDAPFAIGDGVLGAVVAGRERVSLQNLRPSYKVPYYVGPCPVRALSAIPVLEDQPGGKATPKTQALRGILAIDRTDNRPFTPHEEELAAQAARYCLRAIQNERVFVQLERAKVEQGKLYRAAQALSQALSEKDVLEAGVRAAREIASFDLAAVTIFDEGTKMHEVCAAKSALPGDTNIDDLVGARFAHNSGLVSMVVQNRFPLPYRGEFDGAH